MSELELQTEESDELRINNVTQGFQSPLDPCVEIYLCLEAIYDSDSSEASQYSSPGSEEFFGEDFSPEYSMDCDISADSNNYNMDKLHSPAENLNLSHEMNMSATNKPCKRPPPPSRDLYKSLINQSEHPIKPVQHTTGVHSYIDEPTPLQFDQNSKVKGMHGSLRNQEPKTMLQRSLDAIRHAGNFKTNVSSNSNSNDAMFNTNISTPRMPESSKPITPLMHLLAKQKNFPHMLHQTQKPTSPNNAPYQHVDSTSNYNKQTSSSNVPKNTLSTDAPHKYSLSCSTPKQQQTFQRPAPPSMAFMKLGPLQTKSQQCSALSHQKEHNFYPSNRSSPGYPSNLVEQNQTGSMNTITMPTTLSHPTQTQEQSVESKIIAFIQNQGRPCNTNSIRLSLGAGTKKEINPVLYALQRKGTIAKVQDIPPTWKLCLGKGVPLLISAENPPRQTSGHGHQATNISHVQEAPQPSGQSFQGQTQIQSLTAQAKPGPSNGSSTTKNFFEACFTSINKNPVSAFNNYAQKVKSEAAFEIISQKSLGKPSFTVAAKLGNRMFTSVTASNMKEAKRQAADVALREMGQTSGSGVTGDSVDGNLNLSDLPSIPVNDTWTHFDRMAALSHQLFSKIAPTVSVSFAGRKVIACMIMKTSQQDPGRVLSLGAGNRCITGQRISLEGKKVNDSHAEIVARRGLIRVFYKQISSFLAGKESIFIKKGNRGSKLCVKDGVTFHLYISTAPCGDGALFSPRENAGSTGVVRAEPLTHDHKPTFTSKQQGILRTKIEDGEGTLPIDFNSPPQTWDGLLQGERLRTMSCSDKICRWNVLGLQGSLLSHFVEPIYLDSLTLGYLYDHGHLSRAICCRLQQKNDLNQRLPCGYRVNHPCIGRVTAYEPPRETEKTNNISINWAFGDTSAEVTDGRDGACLTRTGNAPTPSRLCKAALYGNFRELCRRFPEYKHLLKTDTYKEAKTLAEDFSRCKEEMKAQFKASRYSQWVSKPMEQDLFSDPLPALDI